MHNLLQLLAKSIGLEQRPARSRLVGIGIDGIPKPLVFMVLVVLLAGPDLFALVELTTLLDLLGATLFLIAYGAGLRLIGDLVLSRLGALFVPTEYSLLIKMRGRPVAVICGVLFVVGHALVVGTLGWVSYMSVLNIARLVI